MAVADTAQSPPIRNPISGLARFSRELLAMLVLFAIYKFGRVVHSDVSVAYDNAQRVWEFERFFRLPNEVAAQQAMLALDGVIQFANTYYAAAHLPGTAAFLIWMYLRRPLLYPPIRRAIIAMTALALLVHLAFPLAPPRMLGHLGFVDTGAIYGPNVYSSSPGDASLVNQYAAMPSLHVGWAMLVAAGLIAAFKTRWRWLWLLHPTITAVAVVGTGNHYWLDSIAACLLLTIVIYLFGHTSPIPWSRLTPPPLRRGRRTAAVAVPAPVPAPLVPRPVLSVLAAGPTVPAEPSARELSSSAPANQT